MRTGKLKQGQGTTKGKKGKRVNEKSWGWGGAGLWPTVKGGRGVVVFVEGIDEGGGEMEGEGMDDNCPRKGHQLHRLGIQHLPTTVNFYYMFNIGTYMLKL